MKIRKPMMMYGTAWGHNLDLPRITGTNHPAPLTCPSPHRYQLSRDLQLPRTANAWDRVYSSYHISPPIFTIILTDMIVNPGIGFFCTIDKETDCGSCGYLGRSWCCLSPKVMIKFQCTEFKQTNSVPGEGMFIIRITKRDASWCSCTPCKARQVFQHWHAMLPW